MSASKEQLGIKTNAMVEKYDGDTLTEVYKPFIPKTEAKEEDTSTASAPSTGTEE